MAAEQASAKLREEVLSRAQGRCECQLASCGDHQGRCHRKLEGAWGIAQVRPGAPALASVIGMCPVCHGRTRGPAPR
jgi:hypothetical protein